MFLDVEPEMVGDFYTAPLNALTVPLVIVVHPKHFENLAIGEGEA